MADSTAWDEVFTDEHLNEHERPGPDLKLIGQRRNRAAKSIDTAIDQFKNGKTSPGRKWSVNNDRVAYRPHMGTKPWYPKGKSTLATLVDKFEDGMTRLKNAIMSGLHDDDLEAADTGTARAPSGSSAKSAGGTFPKRERSDWDRLSPGQKIAVGTRWKNGFNPDYSVRAEVGDKPNATIAPNR